MNGIIVIDKEACMTSRNVVDEVSKILHTKKIGHTGTLDPMATGVLVLCIGKATKIVELITNYDKQYIAEITLGIETDTLDLDGRIINEIEDVNVSKDDVIEILSKFVGKIEQEVPAYSAIKIEGRRLYDYTRKNIDITLPKREIEIYSLSLISDIEKCNGKVKFKIKCHVSKGTYIRSLVRDIGKMLNIPSCMSSLRRIKQGNFQIEDCNTIEEIKQGNYKVLSIKEVLPDMDEIILDKETEKMVRNGAIIDKLFTGEMAKLIADNGELLAIYQTYSENSSKAKPYKMMV